MLNDIQGSLSSGSCCPAIFVHECTTLKVQIVPQSHVVQMDLNADTTVPPTRVVSRCPTGTYCSTWKAKLFACFRRFTSRRLHAACHVDRLSPAPPRLPQTRVFPLPEVGLEVQIRDRTRFSLRIGAFGMP
jgi:hypothetical protein